MRKLLRQALLIIAMGVSSVVLAAATVGGPPRQGSVAASTCSGPTGAPRQTINGFAVCFQTIVADDEEADELTRL